MPPIPEGLSRARWLWIRLITRGQPVRFIYHPPTYPADLRVIRMYDAEGYDIGRLVWQICDACHHGTINQISLSDSWQRHGIGRLLINRALRDGPGYRWTTSSQSPQAKRFFPVMTTETGAAFTERAKVCPHIRGRRHTPCHRRPTPILARDV
jgi:GNAT superfamily N-acetyltransferase